MFPKDFWEKVNFEKKLADDNIRMKNSQIIKVSKNVFYLNRIIAQCFMKWAGAWDFQQFDILTSVDSEEPLQPPFKLRNSKWCSISSLTIIEYSSDLQRLWSVCAYAQADLRLCWSQLPHCWKFHALAQISFQLLAWYVHTEKYNSVLSRIYVW